VVEWADKGLSVLPGEHLLIEMRIVSPLKRKLTFIPKGTRYLKVLSKLKSVPHGDRK
jgi:tRNA A37 threonylcarbamoyladenosine biosynthesis protein TsaE